MMRLSRNSNLAITGFFVNQVPAAAIMEALMGADARKAVLLAGEYPAMIFHRVRIQSTHGDPMFMSPLEFAVMTDHKGVLLLLKAIAEKAGFINAYNMQTAKIENDIALTKQFHQMKRK